MSLRVRTPTGTAIELRRSFAAPRRLVFAAWTRPELLRRWYGARGWWLVECDVDLRVGGGWRFVSRGPGGAEMVQRGVYREIVPPERLVYTERFDDQSYPGEAMVRHSFLEDSGVTTVASTVTYPSRQARDIALRYPMTRGVSESYQRLDELLVGERKYEERP